MAGELVVVDSGARDGVAAEQWQERTLGDGSRHRVYKRYLSAGELAAEIGGEPVLDGHWFVAARATCKRGDRGRPGRQIEFTPGPHLAGRRALPWLAPILARTAV